MDARGIRRGQCLIDGCDCDQYIPPADENIFKCEYCGDPPAKHKKVPDSVSPPSQSQSAPKEKECGGFTNRLTHICMEQGLIQGTFMTWAIF